MSGEKYCNCHSKHSFRLDHLEAGEKDNWEAHDRIWGVVNKKIGVGWLIVLIPVILAWVSFQVVIYDSLKNVETHIAVIYERVTPDHEGRAMDPPGKWPAGRKDESL